VKGGAERAKDRRQTCRKLGPSVLGALMEIYNSLVTSLLFFYFVSFLYSLKPYFFSIL
jgi:hypothetical protein